jgi:hypothetical protein
MTKCKLIFILTGLLFPLVLGAQYTDFDLSKYKLPDIRLHRLDASFDLLNDVGNYLSQDKWDTTKWKSNDLNGSLKLDYYYFRNTEKYQGNLDASLYYGQRLNKYVTESNNRKNNDVDRSISVNNINRFYNQRLFFIEVDPNIYFLSYRDRQTEENGATEIYTFRETNTQLSVPVSVGYGRIEPVEDMRLAVYIIEELQKAGRITTVPPEDVVIRMAREISRIKKKRFFDTRIRKIEELQIIDSFLVANNIISSNDIRYFTVLNDQWDYASGPQRETGFSVNAGVGNDIRFNRESVKHTVNDVVLTYNKNFRNIYEIGGFLNIRYAKPINLYWQTSAGLNISYGKKFTRDPQDKESMISNYETNIFRTRINGLIQYLPDSRTSIGIDFTGLYQNSYSVRTLTELDPDGYRMRDNLFSVVSTFDMYYYISPQLRVQLLATLFGNNDLLKVRYESTLPEDEELTRWYKHNVSLTLTYSFF